MDVVKRWLLLAVISLGIAPIVAQANSRPPPLQIEISAADAATIGIDGSPVYRWRTDGRVLLFGATVGPALTFVDVYFGIIIPGGRTFTWTGTPTTGPILVEGLHPAAQNLNATDSFNSSVSLGGSPQYAFSNGDPLGLYTLFVFVVFHGQNPFDTTRWLGVRMSPLILTE